MIFNTQPIQKNASQKLRDISLVKGKSNELWGELDESSQAAISGGQITPRPPNPLASLKKVTSILELIAPYFHNGRGRVVKFLLK
ncbi:hypothetical protein NDA07_06960 [Microcoleus vaginatus DQ-U2]|uniref:hypothetical protein n=1 Tax=Microcoleus vaginatus TaxID=119532 RepID=UPI0016849BF8|nr:hypothetical protein [Microcoleus sp. FACHB-DQ6]